MTGRDGTGAKDPQSLPRVKGSAIIACEQSRNSRYKAAPESSQRPPLQPHAKRGSLLTKHIVLRLTLPNIISHITKTSTVGHLNDLS